jgi:hypothetical protein
LFRKAALLGPNSGKSSLRFRFDLIARSSRGGA